LYYSGRCAVASSFRLAFLTERGAYVKPVAHATAAPVEERWAQLTS
jgi:hypothetical protein